MGWIVAAFILTGLAILPLGVVLLYDEDGFFAQAKIGPIGLMLYPTVSKNKDKKNEEKKSDKRIKSDEHKTASISTPQKKKGGKIQDFFPFVSIALDFLNELRLKLTVKTLEMKIVLAGGDPCDLAINYGRSWAALGNLMPQLERFLRIKKRDLQIECDFGGFRSTAYFYTHISITLGRSLCLLVRYGVKVLKQFIVLKNSRKGGAQV